LVPLRGGCEGGDTSSQNPGAIGGGAGGGAIQLVSGRAVHLIVGPGSGKGVVHVGGGHGLAGFLGSETVLPTTSVYGPGGGGSGGGILLEAPIVVLDDGAALLAAGGGGGGYGACTPAPDGADASPDAVAATGGACPAAKPAAAGGAGATTGDGVSGAGTDNGSAGGGGGGLGRIRINTADGQYSAGTNSLVRGIATTGTVGRR
jgi:hypothetical protein